MDDAQKVAVINVDKNVDPMRARGAAFIVSPSLNPAIGTSCYFLPWDSRGAAVEMTIPRSTLAAPGPDIFFTAVLSGCTILFKGNAQKPTIFHCGTAGGGEGADTTGNSNDFFRRMVRSVKLQNLGTTKGLGEQVLSSDYMNAKSGAGAAVLHETAFKNKLAHHYDTQLIIENVAMWGCIFGFRVGLNWEFYLQENATISFYRVADILNHFVPLALAAKKKSFEFSTLTEPELRAARIPMQICARPAVVRRVFPGGAAIATVTSQWNTLHK